MRKTVTIILLALSSIPGTMLPLAAQNNPYAIDDECYKYFKQAELLVGKEGFEEVNNELLRTAITKDDKKSQTLYYVERLKNASRSIPSHVFTTEKQDQTILQYMADLKEVADRFGYPQYYYYAYEITQNYFYNHNKIIRTMELVQELQQVATQRKDAYGLWMSQRYMVSLYVAQSDYISAKSYIQKAIKIYEESKDPVIRRQSPSRLYCDLADTYIIGSDSLKINIHKAVKAATLHLDSLRCTYYLAKIAAYEKDAANYRRYRDYCLSDPQIGTISATAPLMFKTLDAIMEGRFDANVINSLSVARVREIKYLANVAEVYGYEGQGFEIERLLVQKFERHIAEANMSKITELDARLGNAELQKELATKSEEVLNVTRLVMILLTILLMAIITFLIIHLRTLRKKNKTLREANEKAELANAAKTRFVQNMSHEVRTPLNAIVGFSQLLSLPDGSFSPEEKEEFSNHIVNNTKMLTMLLDDILNTTAMDSGNYRITFEDGEAGFICQSAISSAEHRLQPGVTMTYVPQFEGQHMFRTDPRRVQQILINLLTNSCKHTTKGEIKLGCSLKENPGEVTFWVTDTGPGIPPDQAEAIFNRFTKLNDFVQGTGLGLSICRDIAGKMNGRVFLDTSYTGGARFVLVLPDTLPQQNI
ncbi:MAG: HAMP domain-containing histidine kinase [Bacteroidales bacterium]|nr:HAMP domain-containing histidine kinase [Bacteroidales bacterium]